MGVLAVGILPFLPELAEIQQFVARYRVATSPGSYLAITHLTDFLGLEPDQAQLNEVMGRTATAEQVRTREAIAAMFRGYQLVEPGLVPTVQWRPDHEPSTDEIGKFKLLRRWLVSTQPPRPASPSPRRSGESVVEVQLCILRDVQ